MDDAQDHSVEPAEPGKGADPWAAPSEPQEPPRKRRNPWVIAGIAVAAALAAGGLLVLAALTVYVVMLNSWANNK